MAFFFFFLPPHLFFRDLNLSWTLYSHLPGNFAAIYLQVNPLFLSRIRILSSSTVHAFLIFLPSINLGIRRLVVYFPVSRYCETKSSANFWNSERTGACFTTSVSPFISKNFPSTKGNFFFPPPLLARASLNSVTVSDLRRTYHWTSTTIKRLGLSYRFRSKILASQHFFFKNSFSFAFSKSRGVGMFFQQDSGVILWKVSVLPAFGKIDEHFPAANPLPHKREI